MMDMQTVTEFQPAFARDQTLEDVKARVRHELQSRGFEYFAYVQLVPLRGSLARLYVGNYPDDWAAHYAAENLDLYDPLYTKALEATAPFFWDTINWAALAKSKVKLPAFGKGLCSGVGIPLSDERGTKAALQIASSCDDAAFRVKFARHKADLLPLAVAMHDRVGELADNLKQWSDRIDGRKHQVLLLIARGLSNPEIAKVLGIQPATVKKHVDALFQLFDINSRAGLAAKAVMLQLVQP